MKLQAVGRVCEFPFSIEHLLEIHWQLPEGRTSLTTAVNTLSASESAPVLSNRESVVLLALRGGPLVTL
jgi:hypothetical protein